MENTQEAGVGSGAGLPGETLPQSRVPFAVGENAPIRSGPRPVGDAYWPAGIERPSEAIEMRSGGGDVKNPQIQEAKPPATVPEVPTVPRQNPVAATTNAGSWGEAGGFPKAPQRQAPIAPRGPIFFDAIRDPICIIMAVVLAGLIGGVGAYLGWRLGAQREAARMRAETENRVASAKAEFEGRLKTVDGELEGARARLADLERANAALDAQGKEREKANADAKAALGALQAKFDALTKSQAENESASRRVADLMPLRAEQERLMKLLQEAVGDGCEVGTDGPYVFVRPKTKLYADNSNRPADAVIGLMKKVAEFEKTYQGPYRLHVEGHTDSSPGPTAAGEGSNLHAGAMRALDIARVLVEAGLPASSVTLQSQGEAFPLRTGKGDDSVATNRRVELIFAPTRTVAAIAVEEPAQPTQAVKPAEAPNVPRAMPVAPAAQVIPSAPAQATGAREPTPRAPAIIRAGTAREPAKRGR